MNYHVIYADPPWHYGDRGRSGSGKPSGAEVHYPTMKPDELKAMEIPVAKDALLFMWVTLPQLDVGVDVMRAWGFDYKTMAHVWLKVTSHNSSISTLRRALRGRGMATARVNAIIEEMLEADALKPTIAFGQGYYTRGGTEVVLIGKRGRGVPIQTRSQRIEQFVSNAGLRHSQKPERFRELIDELVGPEVSRLELFARRPAPEPWAVWGNEVECDSGLVGGMPP